MSALSKGAGGEDRATIGAGSSVSDEPHKGLLRWMSVRVYSAWWDAGSYQRGEILLLEASK